MLNTAGARGDNDAGEGGVTISDMRCHDVIRELELCNANKSHSSLTPSVQN